jgi:type IV secretory pathway TrbD component
MQRGIGAQDMTAVISAERAARTWLTGATGLLIVAIALVMMAWAAPAHPHARPQRLAMPHSVTAGQLVSAVRAGPVSPPGSPSARIPTAGRR